MARILVVDDEESVRAFLKRLLSMHDYAVDAVKDGAEAIDQLHKKRYDLMIIDNLMPKISGPEVVSILRSTGKFKSLPVLVLTGVSVIKEVDAMFALGIVGYMLKPVSVSSLLAKVEQSLQYSH